MRRVFAVVLMVVVALLPVSSSALTATTLTPTTGSTNGGSIVTIKGVGFMREETEKFMDIAAGVEHAVMLSSNGHVWVVGCNGRGQLGANRPMDSCVVTPLDITDSFYLDSDDEIVGIASGDYHSFAISKKHRVLAWGKNQLGQLGDGTLTDQPKPVDITKNFKLDAGDYIKTITGGVDTSFATTNNGRVFFWGDSTDRQDGGVEESFVAVKQPKDVTSWIGENTIRLSLGYKAGISLTNRGFVTTWGNNQSGELGRSKAGELNDVSNVPRSAYFIQDNFDLVEGDEIVDVEAGNGVMAALTKYHRVYIWGDNRTGMLGLGDEMPNPNDRVTGQFMSAIPLDITDLFNLPEEDCISQISIGNSHIVALSQYGEVFSWGEGDYGQLGNGAMIEQPKISNVTSSFGAMDDDTIIVKVLAAGAGDSLTASYAYAIDSDGVIYAWGGSAKGLPGINAISNQDLPSRISDRLTVDVPNIDQIAFGDEPALEFDVVGNETVQALTPPALTTKAVAVTITDSQGISTKLDQLYNYELPTVIDPDETGDSSSEDDMDDPLADADEDKIDNPLADDSTIKTEDNTENVKDDEPDNSDEDNDVETDVNISAPNTGWVVRRPLNWTKNALVLNY